MSQQRPDDAPGGAVAVRPARPDDADDLAVAHVSAWQAAYRGLMSQAYLDGLAVADRAAAWRQRLSDPAASPVLVGTMRGRVAGFASFGPTRDADSGGAGELYALNVHPAHWGTGVGSALLRATENALATMGFADAVLWVVPGNVRARRFYERHGWTDAGARRTAEIHGVTVPEVRYAKVLP